MIIRSWVITFNSMSRLRLCAVLPRSTLIAMIAAMVGLDEQRRIYAAAIAERYRFFSYGDAMLIE